MERFINNNHMTLEGQLKTEFTYDSDMCGQKIYKADLEVPRNSRDSDVVSVMVSDQLVDVANTFANCRVRIGGVLQSDVREDKRGYAFSVYVCNFALVDKTPQYTNCVSLEGYVYRKPFARLTSRGKAVTTILVAVRQENGEEIYIPCTIGPKYALYAVAMEVGTQVKITGSIRSIKRMNKDGLDNGVIHMVRVKEYHVVDSVVDI